MQGTWVRALIREEPGCCGATRPAHTCRACAEKPGSCSHWALAGAHALQRERPSQREARVPQLEKGCMQHRRPSTARDKQMPGSCACVTLSSLYMIKWSEWNRSVVSDSLRPHGLHSPWHSPGQNTGVGSLSLLQGIFPTQGLNPGVPHCRWILYQLSHRGSPRTLQWVAYPFASGHSRPGNWTRVSCIAGRFFTSWAMREAHTWLKSREKVDIDFLCLPSIYSIVFWKWHSNSLF